MSDWFCGSGPLALHHMQTFIWALHPICSFSSWVRLSKQVTYVTGLNTVLSRRGLHTSFDMRTYFAKIQMWKCESINKTWKQKTWISTEVELKYTPHRFSILIDWLTACGFCFQQRVSGVAGSMAGRVWTALCISLLGLIESFFFTLTLELSSGLLRIEEISDPAPLKELQLHILKESNQCPHPDVL